MIIITGASGFIGRHLAKRLLDDGYELLLCSHTQDIKDLFPKVRVIKLNLAKKCDINKLPTKGIEAVFHLAALIPQSVNRDVINNVKKWLDANIIATLNILEYCRLNNIKKLIYASTAFGYDQTDTPADEEDTIYPKTFYGWSKLTAEMLCENYRINYGIVCFSLRLSSVYGEGQSPSLVISKFIKNVIEGREITIWGEGKRLIDFVYIKDVISANICALKSIRPGIYNIGSGKPTSILDLAKVVMKVFSNKHLPLVFDKTHKDDTTPAWLNITKSKKKLGFQPKYSLIKGLQDYKRELKANDKL